MNATAISSVSPRRAKHMADWKTPLIRQRWYVAGRSDEFGDQLVDRWLLERNILFYRTEEGMVVALDNRCPHRSFPLSQGHRAGDAVVCGYHGLTFAASGQCLRVPTMRTVPSNLAIRAYPVIERAPLVWIWMGDPELADEALIPEHFDLGAPGWSAVTNYTPIEADYVGLHENLQDLTHFTFLHSSSIGIPQFESADLEVEVKGERVLTRRESRNLAPPPFWADTLPLQGDRIDRIITTAFKGPALCVGKMVISDLAAGGGARRDYTAYILHFLTPETNTRTHYWWFVVTDFGVDEPDTTKKVRDGFTSTFNEDKMALEAILALKRRDNREDFVEKSFGGDKAGMQMRMILQKLADGELAANGEVQG